MAEKRGRRGADQGEEKKAALWRNGGVAWKNVFCREGRCHIHSIPGLLFCQRNDGVSEITAGDIIA